MGTVSNLRIALYYVYVDLPDSQLQEQVKFHTTICQEKHLKGRIRISTEGINGVLSGELEALQLYQKRMATGLALENGDLNFKYCILRDDIPAKCQIFTELTVKKTYSVISLFDMEPKEKTKRRRGEGGKGRWCENEKSVEAGEEWVDNDQEHNSYRSTIREKMMEYSPSRHLSSAEWHQYLSEATDPLLLDCRNVYESRIGYFASDKAPTLLTNTRKYSDLPNILACNPHVQEKQEIFMYCTGGVRCERVSMLIQAMYPEKKVFQLRGGIQTYLETQTRKHDDPSASMSTNLFRGKNFVFDPRRIDPVHGAVPVIGKCMICSELHDDYDNGHAPSEQKEARCVTCRMLVLICNSCRADYACWGDEGTFPDRPLLYCGVDQCIHEGSAPEPQLISSYD